MEIFRLFGSILVDSSEADKSIQKTGEKAKGLAATLGNGIKTAGKWAAGIATAAAGAATAAGAAAVKVGKEYEVSLQKVSTIADPAVMSLNEMSAAVIELSNKTGESASALNEAVYQAISGSVNTADAVGFVEQATKLAAGGFTDTSTAVDILTTTLNAYGEQSGLTAESVSDMLLMTQNLGKTDVGQLASSMGKIIPTAASVGVQMEELSGMYAVVTANGIATAEATTYMNSMMNELSKGGQQAAMQFENATEEITGTKTSFRDFIKNGGSVTDALRTMTQYAEKNGKALGDCFGSAEAGKAAMVLAANADKVDNAIKEMGNSAGATEKAYAAMTDTLEHKTEYIKNQLQNIGVDAYNSMSGTISEVTDTVLTLIKDNIPVAQDFLTKVLESLSEIVKKILPQALNIIKKLVDPVLKLTESIINPLMEMIDELFPPLMDFVESLIEPITEIISQILPVMVELAKKLLPIITDIIKELLPPLLNILDDLMPLFDVFLELLDPILDIVKALIKPIGDVLRATEPLIQLLVDIIGKCIEPLQENLGELAPFLETVLGGALELVGGLLSNTLIPAFQGLLDFLNGDFLGGLEGFGNAFTGVFDSVFATIDSMFGTHLSEWYDEFNDFWMDVGSNLYEMTHQDEIKLQELNSKYRDMQSDLYAAVKEAVYSGESVEEAVESARRKVLDTSEKLYFFDQMKDSWNLAGIAQDYYNGKSIQDPRTKVNDSSWYGEYYKSGAGLPKLASGGLAYGDTLALIGDNPDARVNPEVVAPLSELSAINANALDSAAEKIAALIGAQIQKQPISIEVVTRLSDDTELTRSIIKNINDCTRQDGVCVIKGI